MSIAEPAFQTPTTDFLSKSLLKKNSEEKCCEIISLNYGFGPNYGSQTLCHV
jgi:hypothetical protein